MIFRCTSGTGKEEEAVTDAFSRQDAGVKVKNKIPSEKFYHHDKWIEVCLD